MIKEINWVKSGDILVTYVAGSKKGSIPFSVIKPYWEYANKDDLEGGRIYVFDDKTIVLILLAVSNQTGVIVAWDVESSEIIHVSNGDFTVAADVSEGYLYSLAYVHSFAEPGNFQLWKVPFGTKEQKDTCILLDKVNEFSFSHVDDYSGSFDDVDLTIDARNVEIRLGNITHKGMKT